MDKEEFDAMVAAWIELEDHLRSEAAKAARTKMSRWKKESLT